MSTTRRPMTPPSPSDGDTSPASLGRKLRGFLVGSALAATSLAVAALGAAVVFDEVLQGVLGAIGVLLPPGSPAAPVEEGGKKVETGLCDAAALNGQPLGIFDLALAQELPRGMAAVPLNPGIIDTDMLRSCFGSGAGSYPKAQQWAEKAVPFLLQSKLESLGAKVETGSKFEPFAIADGRLVTGQNPASARTTADLTLEAIAATRARDRF